VKPRITVIILAVDDPGKSLCFYRDGLDLFSPARSLRPFSVG
jgi:hypothetical protein